MSAIRVKTGIPPECIPLFVPTAPVRDHQGRLPRSLPNSFRICRCDNADRLSVHRFHETVPGILHRGKLRSIIRSGKAGPRIPHFSDHPRPLHERLRKEADSRTEKSHTQKTFPSNEKAQRSLRDRKTASAGSSADKYCAAPQAPFPLMKERCFPIRTLLILGKRSRYKQKPVYQNFSLSAFPENPGRQASYPVIRAANS